MALNNNKKDVVSKNMCKIEEWIKSGVAIKEIANELHISKTTLYKYFGSQNIKNHRKSCVKDLEATMYRAAQGFEKPIKKYAKLKRCEYDSCGRKKREWEEMVEYNETRYFPPDTTASIFLLKNWAGYMNEPATIKLREKEVLLKEQQIEYNNW